MPIPSDHKIDLHGLRPEAAIKRLEQGLHTARAAGAGSALVVTGRGMSNRSGQPILRAQVEAWLRSPAGRRSGVASFSRESKGGALRILFQRPK